ncbi:hypothetical protein [Psychroserpens sp. SPM9]|uniref:hypothetical protein n=1 Tax=Psychroserpens sp. SPM9 TaxID=2975598 RepID=UPI0021A42CFB|nr:hypothetical protein [Psychroserpens sp. SPM9]MDG5491888.1 hypothetical protein [Psychroserpens sp. SPM9]
MISKHFLNALKHRAYIAYQHLKSGDFNSIIKGFVAHIYSNETSYGLELFPDTLTANQLAENSLRIRHFNLEDINALKENMRHIRLVEEDIPTCYIAETKNHVPVFRQWVFKSTENERIQNYFGPIFPKLDNNEALLEGGFTHPNHRGQSIMAKSILNIMNLTLIKTPNVLSLL